MKRFAYDGGQSVCFSREVDQDSKSARLTVSVAMPKNSAPDEEWLSGLLQNFGIRQDVEICPFTNETPFRTTYYYSQILPLEESFTRNRRGSVHVLLPS